MSELQKPSLYVSRELHRLACLFYVSACGAIIAAATANSRRLSHQNPYKTCVSLVELGRTSRDFILVVHFEKIPTKKFPRYGRCAHFGLLHKSHWDFMFLRLSATVGSEQTLPGEAPARPVVLRRPFFRRQVIGLLCGKGVEPSRGRGRPSGPRESQLFFLGGYIHLDIIIITFIRRSISYGV